MAKKRCPSCDKRVTPEASVCPYCDHPFEDRRMIGKEDDITHDDREGFVSSSTTEAVEECADDMTVSATESEETEEYSSTESEKVLVVEEPDETDIPTVISRDEPHEVELEDAHIGEEIPVKRGRLRLIFYSVLVFVVVTAVLLYVLAFRKESQGSELNNGTTTQNQTLPTVGDISENQEDSSWVKEYVGIQWVDEESVGKKDITAQDGYLLYIHSASKDQVVFDLFSYVDGNAAFAQGISSKAVGDSISFTFEDDGFGHSGNGNLHFRDGAIDVDVIVNNKDPLPEGVHSLAMNKVLVPQVLPLSAGVDVSDFVYVDDADAKLTRTADPVVEPERTIYVYGAVSLVADQSGKIQQIKVDYSSDEDRDAYCYDRIDGTMPYNVIKHYFGKANEDYKESPTNILVLTYHFKTGHRVRFVFDGQSALLSNLTIEFTN